jgi:hypothetical protein
LDARWRRSARPLGLTELAGALLGLHQVLQFVEALSRRRGDAFGFGKVWGPLVDHRLDPFGEKTLSLISRLPHGSGVAPSLIGRYERR